MKAFEITEAGKEALLSKKFQMVRVNYANPDMVRARRFWQTGARVRRLGPQITLHTMQS